MRGTHDAVVLFFFGVLGACTLEQKSDVVELQWGPLLQKELGAAAWTFRRTSQNQRTPGQVQEVAILGGSMTLGVGCENETLLCPWSKSLAAAVGSRFRVHNLALSATCTGCVVEHVVPRLLLKVPNASIVLVDYGANDADTHKSVYRQGGKLSDLRTAAMEVLVRVVSALPSKPTIIIVEGAHPVAAHRKVAEHYGLDVVSYARFFKALQRSVSLSSDVVEAHRWLGPKAGPHPPPAVHRALGHLLAWGLLRESTRDSPPCFRNVSYLTQKRERARFPACVSPIAFLASRPDYGSTIRSAPKSVGALWRFSADDADGRRDKLGWLGQSPLVSTLSPDAALSFQLNFSARGVLVVEVLRSYSAMGRVAVYVDRRREPLAVIDGHWADISSQAWAITLNFGVKFDRAGARPRINPSFVPGFQPGPHAVTFRLLPRDDDRTIHNTTFGPHFKIISLLTC